MGMVIWVSRLLGLKLHIEALIRAALRSVGRLEVRAFEELVDKEVDGSMGATAPSCKCPYEAILVLTSL